MGTTSPIATSYFLPGGALEQFDCALLSVPETQVRIHAGGELPDEPAPDKQPVRGESEPAGLSRSSG